jgi:integrase
MSIFKRSRTYWFHFWWNGEHIQRNTRQGNPRAARQMEAAYRTKLAKGEVGIFERKPAPALKDFAQRFISFLETRCQEKPRTLGFWAEKLSHLLQFEPLASARLDAIDESLIQAYIEHRSQMKGRLYHKLAPATINRELATLRRALRMVQEWRLIDRVPRIRLLPGERNREFILAQSKEPAYLAAAPQPLSDLALLIVDTGLRVSEALKLEWRQVHLEPANGARFGYLHIAEGKSRYARRNIPLTDRARAMLEKRSGGSSCYAFPSGTGRPYNVQSINHLHAKVRTALRMPREFVVYSLRHTYGTRLGEAGADAFTIMRLMGHSSMTVSQRYVHPTPATLERAVESLQAMNAKAAKSLPKGSKLALAATISATLKDVVSVSY